MPSRGERLFRLEAGARANSAQRRGVERDAAEFDAIIARLAERGVMPVSGAPVGDEQQQAWAVARQVLRRFPGCASAFANMEMMDFLV